MPNGDSSSTAALAAPLALVVGVPAIVLAVVVGLITPIPTLLLVVLALVGTTAYIWRRFSETDQIVLDYLDVMDGDEDAGSPRVLNLLESLSLASGVPSPSLYLTDDRSINAAAVQGNDEAAAVLTRGAVEQLDRLELEGLLAEVIVRIQNGDAKTASRVAALVAIPLGRIPGLADVAARWTRSMVADDRELAGDLAAAGLTRYPPGLRHALGSAEVVNSSGVGAAHLWVVPAPPYRPAFDLSVRLAALDEF